MSREQDVAAAFKRMDDNRPKTDEELIKSLGGVVRGQRMEPDKPTFCGWRGMISGHVPWLYTPEYFPEIADIEDIGYVAMWAYVHSDEHIATVVCIPSMIVSNVPEGAVVDVGSLRVRIGDSPESISKLIIDGFNGLQTIVKSIKEGKCH